MACIALLTRIVSVVVVVMAAAVEARCPTECQCRQIAMRPVVDCSDAHLTMLPAGLPVDTTQLRLGYNKITSLSNRTLVGVVNVARLWMNNNEIDTIEPGAFTYSTELSWLNLENNKISHIPPNTFKHLQHLFKLVLNGNPLSLPVTDSFLRTNSLQILDLENCGLEEIPPQALENMSGLMTLRLGNNSLRAVNLNISSLFHLDLHKNSLGPSTNRVRLATPKLLRLDLSSCIFGDITREFFESFPKLENFDISDNIIQSFEIDTFQGLSDLKKINITNNLIGSLEGDIFLQNSKLESIDLSNNPITVSTSIYLNNCSARMVILNKCRLRELYPRTLNGFPNATELHLRNNKLQFITKSMFNGMPSLTSIYLDGNKLTQIDVDVFEDLTELTFLDLSRNPLNQAWDAGDGGEELLRSASLETLRMADCALEALGAGALRGLPRLRSLSLEDNRLSALDPSVLRAAPLLRALHLQGNPWECDCPLRALWRWCAGQEEDADGEMDATEGGEGGAPVAPGAATTRCPDAEEAGCGRPSNRRFTTLAVLTCRDNSEEELDLEGDAEWMGAGASPLAPRAPPDRLSRPRPAGK